MLNKCKFHSNNFTKTQAAAIEVKNYAINCKDEFKVNASTNLSDAQHTKLINVKNYK